MIAVTMTAMRRLTILHSEVGERVRDLIALVDRVLEVLEDRLLADEDPRVDAGVGAAGLEELRHRLAIHHVGFLLDLPQLARSLEDQGVLVPAEIRHSVADLARAAPD